MDSNNPSIPNQPSKDNPADKRKNLLIEQLEERILFDAVPIAPVDIHDSSFDAGSYVEAYSSSITSDANGQQEEAKEVVFVDKSVEGYQEIVADFVDGRDVDVFFLNNDSSGLEQIAQHLNGRGDLNAIHIISHGTDAQLFLGDSAISAGDLNNQYSSELIRIGQSLSESGDILIYGCDLASTSEGEKFITAFSELTNADVAASDDLTGSAAQGGDWVLERQTGTIEAQTLSATSYQGTLLETDAGFIVGTETFAGMNEIAVTPLSEGGVSSRTYANAATANNGALSIDLRITLIDTFDENGNVTTGTTDQLPITLSDFAGGPILLARTVGGSVAGFSGHTAHFVVEFFDNANGQQLSVVGDFTFKDIDYIPVGAADPGFGSEAVTATSDQMHSYQVSSNPVTNIEVEDNNDGTTTFTNYTNSGGENDEDRWVSIKFHDMPELNLTFAARNGNTGYGLSTANFTATPISYSQPVAHDDNFATDQDTSVSGNVVTADNGNGVDSDPDNDALEVFLVDNLSGNVGNATTGDNGGSFVINTDGTFTFDPNGDFDYLAPGETATTSVEYTVKDYTGLASTATVTVTISGTNDNPVIVGPIPNQNNLDADTITPVDVSSSFQDSDSTQSLTYDAGTTLPPGLTIDPATGIISGTLDNSASQSGPFTVVITADDGNGGVISQSFIWSVSNPGPIATNNSGAVDEDGPDETGNLLTDNDGNGVDSDPDGDTLSVAAVSGGTVGGNTNGAFGTVTINADGTYTYIVDNNNAAVDALDNGQTLTDTFTYTVSDGEGGTDTATLTITINGSNDAPVVGGTIPPQNDLDGDGVTPVDVSSYFSDPEGDTLSYSALNLPTGLSVDPNTGLITGTLDTSASQNAPGGVFSVTVTAQDDNGESVSTTFDWTIGNPGPTAVDDTNSTNQNAIATGNVTGNDSDEDTLTVNEVNRSTASVNNPVAGSNGGEFTVYPDGSYDFDPNGEFDYLAAGEQATTSVTYQITDSEGGIDTATLTITITGTNDATIAVGTIPDQDNIDSDTIVTLDTGSYFDDADTSDTVTYAATGLPPGLSINSSTGEITGTLDSSASQNGPYTINVTADDGSGPATQTFTWTVANLRPIAVDDTDSTDQSNIVSGNVMDNDYDPDGDTISVNAVGGQTGVSAANVGVPYNGIGGGVFQVNTDGSWTFDPSGDFDHLADGETAGSFLNYRIVDADGSSRIASLVVTIVGTNDAPTAAAIPDQTNFDSDTISGLDVSSYFSDTDATDTLTFSASGLPNGLSIDSAGNITGTIDNSASQNGPYSVTITADDGNGGTVDQTFTWTVSNLAPTAVNNYETTDQNTSINGDAIGDDNDPDGDTITVTEVDGSAANIGQPISGSNGGTFVVQADGSYTFNPDGDFDHLNSGEFETTEFSYLIDDGEGGTSMATVEVTIEGTDDDPYAVSTIPNQSNIDADTISTVGVSGYFDDVDQATVFTYSATGLPAGLSIDPNSGEITGTIDNSASQNGPYSVTVVAADNTGAQVAQTFTWSVSNPGPMATDNTGSVTDQLQNSETGNVISDDDGFGSDSDPDLDVLSVSAVDGTAAVGVTVTGSYGDIVINSDGSYTYTLDSNNPAVHALDDGETLTETFDYTVSDDEGGLADATLTITINGTNDAPISGGTIPPQTNVDLETISTVDVSTYFSDPDGDALTFSATGLPTGLSIDASGQITGTLDSSASQHAPGGVFGVTVTATDDNGETVSSTFDWSISNPAPTAVDDNYQTDEDTAVSGLVATNDSDVDMDSLSFAQTSNPANGNATLDPDGSFTYTPDPDFYGTDSFTYEVTDADGATTSATVTIVVDPINDAPVGVAIQDQSNLDNEAIGLDVSGHFTDIDGDSLTFSATGLPPGLSIDAAGNISGTLDTSASQGGPYSVMVTADDGNGGTSSQTFTWTVSNPGPTAVNDDYTTSEDTPVDGDVSTNDSDTDGDALTFTKLTDPINGTVVFNNDGSFTYTPDPDYVGSDTFDYLSTDADGATAIATVTIDVAPVNDLPVVDIAIPDQANYDSDSISMDVSGNFSDPEGSVLTFSATGLPAGITIDSSGNLSGTIDSSASQSGPYTVVITATDAAGGTVSDTFTWTVANPAPTAANDSYTTSEDTPVSGLVGNNDSDPDGDAVTFSQISNPTNGNVTVNPDGSFSYTPDPDFHGTDSFDYQVTDADGATTTATVEIVVTPVNDLPTVDSPIPDQTNVDSEVINVDVSGNFSDPDGHALTFSATGLPPGLTMDASGNIQGTLDSSASTGGPYTVVVTADDGNGGTVTDTFTWAISNPAPNAVNDNYTTSEEMPVTSSVATNDSDADNDDLTFSQTSAAANGNVSFNPDGTFTYTPDPDFNGVDSFDYSVTDADGMTTFATVTINVDPVNDPPTVLSNVPDQSDYDADNISLDISSNFTDIDGDMLNFGATGLPPGLTIDSSGMISGTVDTSASANGPYTVVVTATDSSGQTATDTFTWAIANPAPAATDDGYSTDEDMPISGNVTGNDTDADGDTLTYNQTSNPANGTVTWNTDGTFTYTPDPDYYGTDSFTYEVVDADGAVSNATVTIDVLPTNDAPVVGSEIADQSDFDSDVINLDVSSSFADIEGDNLTFSATGLPGGLSIDANGVVTGTIDSSASQMGPYSVTVTVSDGNGGSVSDTFVWNVTNPAPDATNDSYNTLEDVPVSGDASVNDNDADGDSVTFNQLTNPANGNVTFNNDGTFTYTPNPQYNGVDSFDYEIVDADGQSTTATVVISVGDVNDPPAVASPIPDQTSYDAEAINLAVSNHFSDVENDALTFSATGLPAGLSMDTAGNIAGTIDNSASQSGPFTVVITADDGNGGTVTDTFTWHVSNPGPTATDNSNSVTEDLIATANGNVISANDGAGIDSDPDGDNLYVAQIDGLTSSVGVAVNGSFGTVQINNDGSYVYTIDNSDPTVNALGNGETLTESFDYTISDGEGGIDTATLTITIQGTNDAPYATGTLPDQNNLDTDSIAPLDTSLAFGDVESDNLTFSANLLPPGLSLDLATGLITGTLDGSASTNGPYAVTITADDGNGGTHSESFTWNVDNPGPIAVDDNYATNEDTMVSGSVNANDSDPDGDTLAFTQLNSPANGSLVFNPDGTFDYTPDPNFFGTDTFDYQTIDADGDYAVATVTITVASVNDTPESSSLPNQSNEDSDPVQVDVSSVFSDVDADTLTFSATNLPPGLTIDPATGNITGTLDSSASQNGPYSVTVIADDGNGATASETFTWSVTNPGPDAQDDHYVTDEDIAFGGTVVNNDSDPDGDLMSYDLVSGPTNGNVQFNPDGTFNYTPNPGYNGTDSFDYQAIDADGQTSTGTVFIEIGAVNDAPTVDDSALPDQNDLDSSSVSIDVSPAFTDPEGDTLVYSATGLPNGVSIDPNTGIISGTIGSSESQAGPFTVVVTADDGNGGMVSSSFTWNLDNPAPVANDDSYSTAEDTPVSGTVATNDSDPDGDAITFNATSSPSNGSVVMNSDGTFTYTPNANFYGTDTFTYQITDVDGQSTTAVATINITPVNDIPTAMDDMQTTLEDTPVTVSVLDNDSDPEQDPLVVDIVTPPTNGSVVVNQDGTVEYTPNADYNGTDSFVYSITDSAGNSTTATVDIDITPDNDAPISQNDSYSLTEDMQLTGTVVPNDYDPDGDPLVFKLDTPPANGTLVFNADGTFTFVPNQNFVGQTTFTYEVCDIHGESSISQVTIEVTPVNDAPVAVDDSESTSEDSSVVINLLGNDYDPDQDLLTVTEINGQPVSPGGTVTLPSGATVTLNIDGTATYNPNGQFEHLANGNSAIDTFEYTITDSEGSIAVAESVITINGENDAPVAEDDFIKTPVDTGVVIEIAENDYDFEGDDLTVILLNQPVGGTAVVNSADGTIEFTPNEGFEGTTHIHYLIEDPSGASAEATVTVEVEPEFRFDAFTNFSQNYEIRGVDHVGDANKKVLSQKIFSLAPEPIFSGFARPGTRIVGRIYDQAGNLIGEGFANVDPGGNWLMQFQGTESYNFYRVEFEEVASGGSDIYGHMGLNPADNSYQAMGVMTIYDTPLSVEGAINNAPGNALEQAHNQNENPLGL